MPSLPNKVQPSTKRKAWSTLAAPCKQTRRLHLRDLFAQDPKRGERMTLEAVGLYLDYSKKRITDETLKLLFEPATESGLKERIEARFWPNGLFPNWRVSRNRSSPMTARPTTSSGATGD